MTPFAIQAYNMSLRGALFAIAPVVAGGVIVSRGEVGTPEFIPERCFIVDLVTAADGFPTAEKRALFNGYIDTANKYHTSFGFQITRIKSFWQILDFYKTATADIGRIRIVTHGSRGWMEFPMFPGGNYLIGITTDRMDAFLDKDEEGLRFIFTTSKTDSPMIHDITGDIVDGMRQINAALLVPLKIDAPASLLTGDVKLFLDIVTDQYHLKFGTVATEPAPPALVLLTATQKTQLSAAFDYIEAEIRKRLVGATLGTAPNTTIVTAQHLDDLKTALLAATPGKLELIGTKKSLPADIMGPAATPGSLANAMAASPRDEDDLRRAISGGTSNLMLSNRTGEILGSLLAFHNSILTLKAGVVISDWPSITAVPDLEDFFFICNDLYMMKNGEFKITGGADITITPAERITIRDGLFAISEIIKAKVIAGSGITSAKLNTLRTTIEKLSLQESQSTNIVKTIPPIIITELHAAVGGLTTGFRTNLQKIRTLMENTSFVDLRGCMIATAPTFMTKLRDFLGTGVNKPTISAPEWWQSFPDGFQYRPGSAAERVFPQITAALTAGFPGIPGADITSSFTFWKGLIDFDPHFTFISALFADTDADRFNFATLEWRAWQTGGAGPGIPVLKMQAQRIDDIVNLNIGDILERFRLIFEIPAANGLNSSQRTKINALQQIVVAFKTLKTSIDAAAAPTLNEINQFYAQLAAMGTDIKTKTGIQPSVTLEPPGAKDKANLGLYAGNVQTYIFQNLTTLIGPFFARIRTQLSHADKEIRYYCNIGLVLPAQSSATQTITNILVMISFLSPSDLTRMFMNALRGWMKIQWKGSAAEITALHARIDALAPSSLSAASEFSRRAIVSNGDPQDINGNPAAVTAYNCPTDDYAGIIKKQP